MKILILMIAVLIVGGCAGGLNSRSGGKTPCACLDQQYFQGNVYELSNA